MIGSASRGEEFRLSGWESGFDHVTDDKRARVTVGIERKCCLSLHILIVIASELDESCSGGFHCSRK